MEAGGKLRAKAGKGRRTEVLAIIISSLYKPNK